MSRHSPTQPLLTIEQVDDTPVLPATRPTWWVAWRVRLLAFGVLGLAVALALFSAYLAWTLAARGDERAAAVDERLAVLEQDLAERRELRAERDDASAVRFREFACALLDTYPEAPELDPLRIRYGCTLAADLPPAAAPAASIPGDETPAASSSGAPTTGSSRPSSTPSPPGQPVETAPPAPTSASSAPITGGAPPSTSPPPATDQPSLLCDLLPLIC